MNIIAKADQQVGLYWFLDSLMTIRISSSESKDGIFMVEQTLPFGESPPLHIHHNEDEAFYILSGTIRFLIGGEERIVHTGDTLIAPKGVPHSFRVESPEGARCLTVATGSDFETIIRRGGRPATGRILPAKIAPTPEVMEALFALAAENGIEVVGPPLA